jgi:hypothetical protein
VSPIDLLDLVASRDSANCGMLLDDMYHLILTEVMYGEKPKCQVPHAKALGTFYSVGTNAWCGWINSLDTMRRHFEDGGGRYDVVKSMTSLSGTLVYSKRSGEFSIDVSKV